MLKKSAVRKVRFILMAT